MAQEIRGDFVFTRLPKRKNESNKGTYGRALIVAGSSAYRGAAALAAEGALRCGAGLVTLASTEPVFTPLLARLPECCLFPCPAAEHGGISATALEALQRPAAKATALLIGPGLGNTPDTLALVSGLVERAACPVVLDADALNAAAGLERPPHPASAPLLLTPHPGEMARLTGLGVEEINADRAGIASNYARSNNCIVVLKGYRTVVAGPQGELLVNTTGGPGLSRGGSGDVLAGMLTALLAQGLAPLDAACCAVWLHGAAGDRAAKRLGQYGMLPQDLVTDLQALFAENGF